MKRFEDHRRFLLDGCSRTRIGDAYRAICRLLREVHRMGRTDPLDPAVLAVADGAVDLRTDPGGC